MKELNRYVNIIPVIGKVNQTFIKGDSLTYEEILKSKKEIIDNCLKLNIELFDVYHAINVSIVVYSLEIM